MRPARKMDQAGTKYTWSQDVEHLDPVSFTTIMHGYNMDQHC